MYQILELVDIKKHEVFKVSKYERKINFNVGVPKFGVSPRNKATKTQTF